MVVTAHPPIQQHAKQFFFLGVIPGIRPQVLLFIGIFVEVIQFSALIALQSNAYFISYSYSQSHVFSAMDDLPFAIMLPLIPLNLPVPFVKNPSIFQV